MGVKSITVVIQGEIKLTKIDKFGGKKGEHARQKGDQKMWTERTQQGIRKEQ